MLEGKDTERVGFTSIAADMCFSPVKNATAEGAALQKMGSPPGVAATGEADQYAAFRIMLRSIGCKVVDAPPATYQDITIVPGPQIVLSPDFVCCPAEYKTTFPTPEKVQISARSSLVVKGSGIVIESMSLDGALLIECEEGATGVIRDLAVENAGWALCPVENSANEIIAMRGYTIQKTETKHIVFKNDGSIEGGYDPDAVAKESAQGKKETVVPSEPIATSAVTMPKEETKSDVPCKPATVPAAQQTKEAVVSSEPIATSTFTTSEEDMKFDMPTKEPAAKTALLEEEAVVSGEPIATSTATTPKEETKSDVLCKPAAVPPAAVPPSPPSATKMASDSQGAPELSLPASSEASQTSPPCPCAIL